jgi:DNA-binding transcriptional MerR regulator
MGELIKIREMSLQYGISARALKYYEEMGLITSTRSDDYAYRLYDDSAVQRLEQILILRKLNISIKDIQRIFNTVGSDVVLEVLGKKVNAIDEEVALLHELKEIVLDFIRQIEQADFGKESDVKLLYEKAKEIENQIINVDYDGNSANVNRLLDVTEKLNKKIPDVMVV